MPRELPMRTIRVLVIMGLHRSYDVLRPPGCRSVSDRLVQFSFGELVEVRSIHSLHLGPRVPKHITGRAPGARRRVPVSVAAISFLRPEALILLIGQSFEALKEPLGQPCPRLRIQLEDFGLEVVDTHTPILPQRSEADLGGPTSAVSGGGERMQIGRASCRERV